MMNDRKRLALAGIATVGALVLSHAVSAGPTCCPSRGMGMAMGQRPMREAAEPGAEGAEQGKEKEAALKAQATCPMMQGMEINKDLYVDHEGRRIHVCCPGCIEAVQADPDGAVAALAERGEAPRQALCPVRKENPVDAEHSVDHEGQRVFLCGPGCVEAVQADPDAALETLRKQGVAPASTPDGAAEKPEEE